MWSNIGAICWVFWKKVGDIVRETVFNPRVFNGSWKIHAESLVFMTRHMILESIDGLKLKNKEGYDRIPQRIFIDARDILIEPLTDLFWTE